MAKKKKKFIVWEAETTEFSLFWLINGSTDVFFQFCIKIYIEGLPDGSAKHLGVLLTTSQTLLINRQHLKWHTMNSVIYCDIKFQAFISHWYLDQITNKLFIYILYCVHPGVNSCVRSFQRKLNPQPVIQPPTAWPINLWTYTITHKLEVCRNLCYIHVWEETLLQEHGQVLWCPSGPTSGYTKDDHLEIKNKKQ